MTPAQIAAAIAVAALGVLSLAAIGLTHPTFAARAAMLLSAVMVAGGLIVLERRALRRRELATCRKIEAICDMESGTEDTAAIEEVYEPLPDDSPFRGVIARLHEVLAAQAARLVDSEDTRASLEVLYRRAIAEQQRLADIVSRIPEPILAVDQYDKLVLTNRSAEDLLSLGHDHTAARALTQIDRCQRLVSLLTDARKRRGHATRSEDLEIEDAQGRRRWYNVTLNSIGSSRSESGSDSGEGVVAVMRDVSRQRQMQKQHAEFVASASHEMKAPLSGIKAYVELLADATDEATREEFLGVINGQTDRLQRLIENLLNIARIEAGVVKVHKHAQPLNEILTEAMHVVQPLAEAKQIAMQHELSPLYLGVFVDRDMMLQSAINLLSNAVKYTAPGGEVTLRSRLVGDEVHFDVDDTGVGLSADDCVKVFSKFYRVAKDQNMAPGTGLGLPLAKYIVEDVHGGKLTVISQLGVGSTFTVSLPLVGRGNRDHEGQR